MVNTASRTWWDFSSDVQFDVWRQVIRKPDGLAVGEALFQSELVGRCINLAEVVDTGMGSGGCSGFYKIGNSDGSENNDDGNYDQDFPD